MRKFSALILAIAFCTQSNAQKNKLFKGMYIQWGYNKEWYTNSNIHFKLDNGDNFKLIKAKAHDKPDLSAIYESPLDISIPQYNYRLGFYLNKAHTKSIELNFDHIKYVVKDGQNVRIRGEVGKTYVDKDTILDPDNFLHLEHTDGGNLLHVNYVQQNTILKNKKGTQPKINTIWKLGAGINIPRTDFSYKGDRFNNDFHVAGYNFAAEAGARWYFSKKFFLEATGKTGYVRYINALANTNSLKGNRVTHGFGYFQLIALIGYDINFR
jgi:hypothetical protein